MPGKRINIILTEDMFLRLAEYKERVWGDHHATSAILQRALKEFLDSQDEIDQRIGLR